MDKFIKLSSINKKDIFTESSNILGMNTQVVEKDFWVCWVLDNLFKNKEIYENMIFKGGTSLSKSYNLIERFSEDCDLTINRKILNIKDPLEEKISNKEIERRINNLMLGIRKYIREFILPSLANICKNQLGTNDKWHLELDEDELTILFSYPTSLGNFDNDYIKPTIRLEIGARGGTTPRQDTTIKPYLSQNFLNLFDNNNIVYIPTLSPERTFWEKLTILHGLFHRRLKGKQIAERISRHYYDVYMLIKSGIDKNAIKDISCLEEVVKNNIIFFKDNNASQNTAKPGSFHLIPSPETLNDLKKDYEKMEVMILGTYPKFNDIIDTIKSLENILNIR